ncbi:hypothetical protein [Candidatus Caldatribacterium saccharofermentans]|uniref:hypothetical protein n=1 Tax=Candidatus Caldatribacterium saccharofermentans TaxID=1454753 RepID=UPI003CFE3394
MGDVLRGAFFIALAAVAIDTYYRIRALIRETHYHASTYGALPSPLWGLSTVLFPLPPVPSWGFSSFFSVEGRASRA